MELVEQYTQLNEFKLRKKRHNNLPTITLESVLNKSFQEVKGMPINSTTMMILKEKIKEEMISRRLHNYFSVELSGQGPDCVSANATPIDQFDPTKECVTIKWN
jgi:hypothetical protein